MKKESERDGERKGELKKAVVTAGKLYEMGLDIEEIAQAVHYAVEMVKGDLTVGDISVSSYSRIHDS